MKLRSTSQTRAQGFRLSAGNYGAVLLEVLLALVLFVTAATIITASMNASLEGLDRLKLNTHAGNLAATVLSELQLGLRSTEANGAQAFESPFQDWSFELALAPMETEAGEASDLTQVEVVIRHQSPELVFRQAQWLKLPSPKTRIPPEPITAAF